MAGSSIWSILLSCQECFPLRLDEAELEFIGKAERLVPPDPSFGGLSDLSEEFPLGLFALIFHFVFLCFPLVPSQS